MARTTKKQLAEERALEARNHWLVQFSVPGGRHWVYVPQALGGAGTLDPDAARDFGSRGAARTAADNMMGPRSSLVARVTSRQKKIA